MTEAKDRPDRPKRVYTQVKPKAPPPKPKPGFNALVELNRDHVLELESRGYLRGAIASATKLPHAVIDHILTHKAKPKRRTP